MKRNIIIISVLLVYLCGTVSISQASYTGYKGKLWSYMGFNYFNAGFFAEQQGKLKIDRNTTDDGKPTIDYFHKEGNVIVIERLIFPGDDLEVTELYLVIREYNNYDELILDARYEDESLRSLGKGTILYENGKAWAKDWEYIQGYEIKGYNIYTWRMYTTAGRKKANMDLIEDINESIKGYN